MEAVAELPFEMGMIYEGERIRGPDMYVELGGPKVKFKAELTQAREASEIEDGKVMILGPDLSEMEEGGRYNFGILMEVAGEKIEKDLEAVLERRIHEFCNYVEGFMHLNQRYDIWCRVGKKAYEKGFNSLKFLGLALVKLFKAELPIIEKIQFTFITDEKQIVDFHARAVEIYSARDARARALKDEDVDEFYGCVLCQSFAPTHVCTVTPTRIALCGAITWFDARAASRVDPKGPNFPIPKGEVLDDLRGEYSGINEVTKEKSLGEVEKVYLHSIFDYPQTSCGCFESIAFYIPEVDGIGVVPRDFQGEAVNGLAFSAMATQAGGGKQSHGFLGMAVEYMRSPKFLQADGGWERIVWLPSQTKEAVLDSIPEEMRDKILTENDVNNLSDLKEMLL
ncbi:MAG: CO dehydrogenase/CO-methylating acetyl-CoA synthase complex subunit beta, partial [Theionarchaea archaeon]|nr:CO dehydrogenase/CO-methylating acetyl-CoA synthase complex subunit beta [Theionarchaea archaeon]